MGSYTAFQKLYKVGPDELVNPETALNYNWRILDGRVKHLLGWVATDKTSIYEEEHDPGFKFLKRENNSTWIVNGTSVPIQDLNAFINTWTIIPSSALDPAWKLHDDPKFGRFMYYLDADGDIYLRGTLQMVGNAAIPVRTTINVATLPVGARPTNSRYLFQHSGNTDTTGYATYRWFFGATGLVSIVRYGDVQSLPGERFVTFNGLAFPRDVGA